MGAGACLGLSACEYRPPAPSAEAPPVAPPKVESVREGGTAAYKGDLSPFFVRAQASSTGARSLAPEYAFDGSMTTRWSSVHQDDQWIEGYFDRTVSVERVELHWELARASDCTIQWLNRDGVWVDGPRIAGEDDMVNAITFSRAIRTGGLRIACHRRATKWGNSLFEVKVFGQASGDYPEQSLLGWQEAPSPWELREREIAERLLKAAQEDPASSSLLSDDQFLELVSRRSFDYFWWETNPTNGLTRDRGRNFASSEEARLISVAAVGFALSAYVIGAERGWVPREEALERVRITLRTFAQGPIRNVRGFFPHFVDYFTAQDAPGTEISTIDTALFLAGMITTLEYFDDPEVRELSHAIYERVDWAWARNGHAAFVSHGLRPDGTFFDARWGSFTEGLLIYMLGIGSPSNPLPPEAWQAMNRHVGDYEGHSFLCEHGFQSIFRYQYPALWFDFLGWRDPASFDYFENVAIATLAMRQYCLRHADKFPHSYGPDLWGQGAADGPGDRYMIYGFPPGDPYSPVDGTVIPYAIAGSISFLPQHVIRSLRHVYDEHRTAWGKYGFADSINPTRHFVARDVLGLDQGTILLAIENYRSGLIWKLFMGNEWMVRMRDLTKWTRVPSSRDPEGPLDLARHGGWKFITGDGPYSRVAVDESHWDDILVPDRWENSDVRWAKYDGIAWYRLRFPLEEDRLARWKASGLPLVLHMAGVDDIDTTFLNGELIGETADGEPLYRIPRRYEVRPELLKAGENVLAVRVVDQKGNGGIWLPPIQLGPDVEAKNMEDARKP